MNIPRSWAFAWVRASLYLEGAAMTDIATAISTPGGQGEVERIKLDVYLVPGQYDILKGMRGKRIAVTLQELPDEQGRE